MGNRALLQGDLPNPGIKPRSPILQVDSLLSEAPGKPAEITQDQATHLPSSLGLMPVFFPVQEPSSSLLPGQSLESGQLAFRNDFKV